MFSTYYTRSGEQVNISGVSQYYSYYKEVSLYTGLVGGETVTWDEKGRFKMNQLFGDKAAHELDLVSFENEVVVSPGVYYMELKK